MINICMLHPMALHLDIILDGDYAEEKFEEMSEQSKIIKELIEAKNVETLRKAEMEAGDGSLYPLDGEDQNQVPG